MATDFYIMVVEKGKILIVLGWQMIPEIIFPKVPVGCAVENIDGYTQWCECW